MKKLLLFICVLAGSVSGLSADAPDFDVVPITRRVCIENASDVPDVIIVALTYSISDGQYRAESLSNGQWLEPCSPDEEVFITAIPKILVRVNSLNNLNFAKLIKDKDIGLVRILQPVSDYRDSTQIRVHEEYAVYRITAYSNIFIRLSLSSLEQRSVDGSEKKDIYIREPSTPQQRNQAVAGAVFSASATLTDSRNPYRYYPAMAFDGQPETGWSEGSAGPGYGHYLEVELPEPLLVDEIQISPGWFQGDYHRLNYRVKRLEILLDGQSFEAVFTDSMKPQSIKLGKSVQFRKARFIIRDVFPAGKWEDTPIAEITFFHKGNSYLLLDDSQKENPVTSFDHSGWK